jgi:tRNA pseudouridine38-40 synthase
VLGVRSLKLTLAYDGTAYAGWQRQEREPSIQQALEEAFVPLVSGGGAPVAPPTVVAAGRTDAGVHALGQVASVNVSFDLAASAVQRALNVRLPPDIRVVGVVDAAEGFHARYHAVGKTYRYRIATTPVLSPFGRQFVFHYPGRHDVEAMREAAGHLIGRHDFASFQTVGSWPLETTRTLHRLDLIETPGELVIEVDGDGFLRHMVRAIAGTLVEVGARQRPAASVADTVAARDRNTAGRTLPAQGLTLVSVRY